MERKIKRYVHYVHEIGRDAEEDIHGNLLAYAREINRRYISPRRYVGTYFTREASIFHQPKADIFHTRRVYIFRPKGIHPSSE